MRRFKGECENFRFNKCPIYTHDGASAKFSTNSQEMDNSAHLSLLKKIINANINQKTSFPKEKFFVEI
jgi:hypothetical protein